jgi:sterol 3beta-glucosyltransferase
MRFSFDMLQRSHDDILTLYREADLVVVSAQSAAGKNEADQLGLPYLSVTLMPWAIPWDDPERPFFRRIAYGLIDGLASLITTMPLNRMRKKQGLPPVGREGFTSLRLNLVPVSPAVYEPNPHWEPRHRIVGYWFAEDPTGWAPSADLLAFLESGQPPVLVSLGAMSLGNGDANEVASLFVDAIHQAGVRAIIQGWEADIKQLSLPPAIGFGTTAAGLQAGIPALVIPHIADQFFWAKIVHELGVGPEPIRRTKLSTNTLAESLHELVHNDNLRAAAISLGEQIRVEKGIDNAVRQIEEEFH